MGSIDVSARDQVLAELATPGPVPGDALALLVQVRQTAVFTDQVPGHLARLAGLADATGACTAAGYTSAAAFLRHGCGRSPGRAGELVATGRALPRLTATRQAMAAGLVSFDAAHIISRTTAQITDGQAGDGPAGDGPAGDDGDGPAGEDTAGNGNSNSDGRGWTPVSCAGWVKT